MSEYTVEDLDESKEKNIKVNVLGDYEPDAFWKEYGKSYLKTFHSAKGQEKGSLYLNVPSLIARFLVIKPQRVLEVGCGFGRILPYLLEGCPSITDVFGLELSEDMIKNSQHYLEFFPKKDKIHITQGKAQSIPHPDKSFDLVYTHVVLTHIPPKDIPIVTKEISRVAKDWIVHIERFAYPYEHPHPHRWSHMIVPYYLDLGWELKEMDQVNLEHFTKVYVFKR